MRKHRTRAIAAGIVALAVAPLAHAQTAPAVATVRLDTVQKIWVDGDARGPRGAAGAVIGKNTGAGVMDANFAVDGTAAAKANADEVLLGTTFTRSSLTPNDSNSFMQGGFALARLSATDGLKLGQAVDLPQLDGERAYMRPLIAFTPRYVVLVAAAEDNETNNGNPKPVLYLADKQTGQLVTVPNNPRRNQQRPGGAPPIDLMRLATRSGVAVINENNATRGPHQIVATGDNTFIVGMQYNNAAVEAFGLRVEDDGTVRVPWVERYSDAAVHNRPQVAYTPGAPTAFVTAVECNAQPANIGIRVTELDVQTGRPVTSKIVVRANPAQNKYVAEPHIADLGDNLAIQFAYTGKARQRTDNGTDGHAANGSNVTQLALFRKSDLGQIGDVVVAPANYQRHASIFGTKYGPDEAPAVGVISGSSTGVGGAFLQVIPLKTDGTLGVKDPLKMYRVSTYSDVANVQVRGKRNPNNQGKGFVNGLGDVRNPGYGRAGGFYPEARSFSFSTVTGYSGEEAKTLGKRNSLYLSLVPSTWKPGIATAPGAPSDSAGTSPAPTTTGPATSPDGASSGGAGSVVGGEGTTPSEQGDPMTTRDAADGNAGCSATPRATRSGEGALAGAALVLGAIAQRRARRRRGSAR